MSTSTIPHVDISEVIKQHFKETKVLPDLVFKMDPGQCEELIDALSSDEDKELIDAINRIMEW